MEILTNEQVGKLAAHLAIDIVAGGAKKLAKAKLWGVPRGGIPVAYILKSALERLGIETHIVDSAADATHIVDDLVDSGKTREYYVAHFPRAIFVALLIKKSDDGWIVFPWESEANATDGHSSADDIPLRLLQYIGEDVTRGGLQETPKRYLKAWKDYTKGYDQNPEDFMKVFKDGAENCDQMIIMKRIRIYSQCEHHLAPFWGHAHVAYIPDGSIVGISKLARVVDMYARRLQVQERLTNQVADCLEKYLKPKGVAVTVTCRHMCMEARGVQSPGTHTTTSALRGAFMDNASTRQEFYQLTQDSKLEV